MPIALATPITSHPLQLRPHFSSSHSLAEVAARHCRRHVGHRRLVSGRVACGTCWELAIRDDEKFAVEHDLPRALDIDPDYVDDIAVRQALGGRKVPLTRAERAELARRQAAAGHHPHPAGPGLRLVA